MPAGLLFVSAPLHGSEILLDLRGYFLMLALRFT
jgi:hypothetical protein